jgi:hypothetical protein
MKHFPSALTSPRRSYSIKNMTTDFTAIPPPQKYLTLAEIYNTYGKRAVVAYNCKMAADAAPRGGYVIAAQNKPGTDYLKLKKYMRQFQKKYPAKQPVYFIRFEDGESEHQLTLIYDNGSKEKRHLPEIEEKKSERQQAVEKIPAELLAQALKSKLSNR